MTNETIARITVSDKAGKLISSIVKNIDKQKRDSLKIVKIERNGNQTKLVITDGKRLFIIDIHSDIEIGTFQIMSVIKQGKYMYYLELSKTDNQFPDYTHIIGKMKPVITNETPVMHLSDRTDSSVIAIDIFRKFGVCIASEFIFNTASAGLSFYQSKCKAGVFVSSNGIEGVILGLTLKD